MESASSSCERSRRQQTWDSCCCYCIFGSFWNVSRANVQWTFRCVTQLCGCSWQGQQRVTCVSVWTPERAPPQSSPSPAAAAASGLVGGDRLMYLLSNWPGFFGPWQRSRRRGECYEHSTAKLFMHISVMWITCNAILPSANNTSPGRHLNIHAFLAGQFTVEAARLSLISHLLDQSSSFSWRLQHFILCLLRLATWALLSCIYRRTRE